MANPTKIVGLLRTVFGLSNPTKQAIGPSTVHSLNIVTGWAVTISVIPSFAAGSISPANGLNLVASGNTLVVTFTPNGANGYVLPTSTNLWQLDNVYAGHANPYTIPSQANGTMHILNVLPLLGWGITADSTTTTPGYIGVASGYSSRLFIQSWLTTHLSNWLSCSSAMVS